MLNDLRGYWVRAYRACCVGRNYFWRLAAAALLSICTQPVLAADVEATLVQTIRTSDFLPPSPDPAGIAYLPGSDVLLIGDSEVNEMAIFQGANVFAVSRSGNLIDTFSTLSFSDEPTGVAVNPTNGFCFFSDDTGTRRIYVVDPGLDGVCVTADDSVTSFRSADFGNSDPEDVAYGNGTLFIVDGANDSVFRLTPGNNGIFDGVPPGGDDQVSSFGTLNFGVNDPEGIAFNPVSSDLYIVGKPRKVIAQVTTGGQLLRTIGIDAANALKPAGLTFAPGSVNPLDTNLYVVDRGVDNGSDPSENDGKVYELQFPPVSEGNAAPMVDAGQDQAITLPAEAVLSGSVVDDGLPSDNLTQQWNAVTGPGQVSFSAATQLNTNATFSLAGTYTLRLTADDGELQGQDNLTVEVAAPPGGSQVLNSRIDAGTDDAEERSTQRVQLFSSDLELVFDGTNQHVGLRFNNIAIPPQATIVRAYVQFKVDEPKSVATTVIVQGQAADNAATFQKKTSGDISGRPRTAAAVSWSPDPWLTVGAAGLDQQTPELASVVQEIIDRPDWSSGNSLVLIVTGSGERVAESYDGDEGGAPLLHVEYTVD